MSKSYLALILSLLGLTASLMPSARAELQLRRNLELEWEKVEGATQYEVQIVRKDSKDKTPMRVKVNEPKWSANIKPGLYLMQIRSFDDRKVPGTWSPPTELKVKLPSVVQGHPQSGEVVKSRAEKIEPVQFNWDPVPGAEKYKIIVRSANGWKDEREVSDTKAEVKVPVADRIDWNVTAIDSKGELGDENAQPVSFQLRGPPLPKPKIERPFSKYIREFEWKTTPGASSYSYKLDYHDHESKKWSRIDEKEKYTEQKISIDISRPSGRYRLQLQAHGENRDSSPQVQMEVEVRGGFRDPAALDRAILRDSIEKPTNFYAIASYLITDIEYQGVNVDDASKQTFAAVGGTGRIGGGYQHPESQWGGFAIVDLSGFTVGGQNFTFASSELHITRKLELGQGGLLLGGAGVFYKELPILQGTSRDGFRGMGKVKAIGPHIGFTYWLPLSLRYGVQLNGRVYYTSTGGTTLDEKVYSSLSYQYGLLGSYRLTPAWMGYAGYAFRKDNTNYSTSTDPQYYGHGEGTNSISIQGHYLNLILEFSF